MTGAAMSGHPIIPGSQEFEDVSNLVLSHYDQAQKAKEAWDKGQHSEAVGHTLAAVTPFVGPAAASAANRRRLVASPIQACGSILPAGTQTLTATFMPADTADYLPVTVTTTITVAKATT